MERIVPASAKIVKRPSITATLKALELNRPTRFYVKQFKTQRIRTEISVLRKKGYEFTIDEKNIPDGCIVTRSK